MVLSEKRNFAKSRSSVVNLWNLLRDGSRRHSPEEVTPQDQVTSDSSQASTPQMSGTPPAGERECSAATRGSTGTATTSGIEERGCKIEAGFRKHLVRLIDSPSRTTTSRQKDIVPLRCRCWPSFFTLQPTQGEQRPYNRRIEEPICAFPRRPKR